MNIYFRHKYLVGLLQSNLFRENISSLVHNVFLLVYEMYRPCLILDNFTPFIYLFQEYKYLFAKRYRFNYRPNNPGSAKLSRVSF